MTNTELKTTHADLCDIVSYLQELINHWLDYAKTLQLDRLKSALLKNILETVEKRYLTLAWNKRYNGSTKIKITLTEAEKMALNFIITIYPLPTHLANFTYLIGKGLTQ